MEVVSEKEQQENVAHQNSVSPESPCTHCGLPVGFYPVIRNENPFCCTGCEFVYAALEEGGFKDTFYRLTELDGRGPAQQSSRIRLNELELAALDSNGFLERFAQPQSDGSYVSDLFLVGIHCSACVWLIERLPHVNSGVLEARVDMARSRLTLQWYPDRVPLSDIARWLAGFGYSLSPTRQQISEKQRGAERKLLIKTGVAWALAGNIMLLAFAFYSGLDLEESSGLATAGRWVSLLLAVPAVTYCANGFFRRALGSIRLAWQRRSATGLHIDVPIALGITIGFLHSAYATISAQSDVWFDSIAVLIAALLTARWLHVRSTRLAQNATEQLLNLIPTMVRRVTNPRSGSNEVESVPIENIVEGDVVAVYGGEVVPVDGKILEGESALNRAVLTGESRPEQVSEGDTVHAGTTNLTHPIQIEVEAAGEATRLGKLIRWVEEGSGTKAPIVLWADRISGYFVITVLFLALGTALLWMWLDPVRTTDVVVALLVITCPCALGMATPLAMAIASGKAARNGIYIKNGESLQRLTEIDTIILDKTGTLTEGSLHCVEIFGDENAARFAAVLETRSHHPIAQAITARFPEVASILRNPDIKVEHVRTHSDGMSGKVNGKQIRIGKPDWVMTQTESSHQPFSDALEKGTDTGHTVVCVSVDEDVKAVIWLGDRIRSDAFDLVTSWKSRGMDVWLLSGDHPDTAAFVGESLAIPSDHILGHVSPEAKKEHIELLQKAGHTVAMIGDGFNDAGALRTADIGVAVKGGSSASMLAADVFITSAGLEPVKMLFSSAPRVMNVIRRNLGFSLLYNAGGAVAAILGWVGPLIAAIAMPISSLVVVGLSIGQRTFLTNSRA